MKTYTTVAVLYLVLTAYGTALAVEPDVVALPFEPPVAHFFKAEDKFAHPPEIIAPHFLFPFEARRHAGAFMPAEVVVLVQLDGKGFAKTLKVLSSTHEIFTQSAIAALKKARWDFSDETWFYYRAVYTLDG